MIEFDPNKFLEKISPFYDLQQRLRSAMVPHDEAREAARQQELKDRADREWEVSEAERNIKEEFEQMVKKIKEIIAAKPEKKLTASRNGEFGLINHDIHDHTLRLSVLNKPVTSTAHFAYPVMEHHAVVVLDMGGKEEILKIEVADPNAMKKDMAEENQFMRYTTTYKFPADGSLPENAKELIERMRPLLEAYDWPLSENPE